MARFLVWFGVFIGVFLLGFLSGKFAPDQAVDSAKSNSDSLDSSSEVKYLRAIIAQPDTVNITINSKGRVSEGRQINITSEVQGKIVESEVELKKGANFSKGTLLAKIDHSEAELQLKARKSSFINLTASILPDIRVDFPASYTIWEAFFKLLSVNKSLPDLPPFNGSEDDFIKFRNFLSAKGFMTEYFTIRSEEERFRKYYIFAPFDGSVIEAISDIGTIANPGTVIVRVARKGNKEVEVPVAMKAAENIKLNSIATIITQEGKATQAKVVRKGDFVNPLTQSVSVFVEIPQKSNIVAGEYVDVILNAGQVYNAIKISRRALQNDNKIYYIQDSALIQHQPKIEYLLDTHAVISQVDSGKKIVVEPVSTVKQAIKIGALIQE